MKLNPDNLFFEYSNRHIISKFFFWMRLLNRTLFHRFLSLFLLMIYFSIPSCIGIKVPRVGSPPSGKHYKEFYMGDGTIQYFIEPLKFKSQKKKLTIDFTFKNYNRDTTKVIANFSIIMPNSSEVQSIKLLSDQGEVFKNSNLTKLYTETHRKFHARYSCIIDYAAIESFFNSMDAIILVFHSTTQRFKPSSKTSRISKKLNQQIFSKTSNLQ